MLQNSFATQLLENSVHIRFTKELAGHNSIATIERHKHEVNTTQIKIISLLKELEFKNENEKIKTPLAFVIKRFTIHLWNGRDSAQKTD